MSASENNVRYISDAVELRQAFDQVFAAPDVVRTADLDDFLGIRVGGKPFALRVTELSRIEAVGKIIPLPGGNPWLLGLTNSQGKLVPVFSLELALGFERTVGECGWIAICDREEPLGLVFDSVEGYSRIARTDIVSSANGESSGKHDQQTIRSGGDLRSVIHLPHILESIRERILVHPNE